MEYRIEECREVEIEKEPKRWLCVDKSKEGNNEGNNRKEK
jgi:hypothetical protein